MKLRQAKSDVFQAERKYDKSIIRFPHLIKRNFKIFSNIKFRDNLTSTSGVLPRGQTDMKNLIDDFLNL